MFAYNTTIEKNIGHKVRRYPIAVHRAPRSVDSGDCKEIHE